MTLDESIQGLRLHVMQRAEHHGSISAEHGIHYA